MTRLFRIKSLVLPFLATCLLSGCPATESDASTSKVAQKPQVSKPVAASVVASKPAPAVEEKKTVVDLGDIIKCPEMSKTLETLVKKPPAPGTPVIAYVDQLKLTFPSKDGTVVVERSCYQLK